MVPVYKIGVVGNGFGIMSSCFRNPSKHVNGSTSCLLNVNLLIILILKSKMCQQTIVIA